MSAESITRWRSKANGFVYADEDNPLPVAIDAAAISVTLRQAANATTTSVGGSASSVTLLAANANRVAYSVYNDSTAILYLLEDNSAAASSSNYTWQIAPGGGWINDEYTGKVVGIWASATGNARITERTP